MVLNILRGRKFQKKVLIGLLVIIIPAFVLWGVGNVSNKEEPIGTIAGKKIYKEDLAKSAQGMKVEIMMGYYMNYDLFSSIIKNRPMFNKMSWDRLIFLTAAKKSRTTASNKDVLMYLSTHPLFSRNGKFDPPSYNYVLSNALHIEPREFEEYVRENLSINAFQKKIYGSLEFSDKELKDHFKRIYGTFSISYIPFGKEDYTDITPPTKRELEIYYKENADSFRSQPMMKLEYIAIPYEDVDQKNEAINKITGIYQNLLEYPTKFSEVAEQNGLRYQRTELISHNSLIPGIKYSKYIYKVASEMGKGEIAPPVYPEGNEGEIFLLHKIENIKQKPLSFDEAKKDIIDKLTSEKQEQLAEKKAYEFYEDMKNNSLTLEQASKKINKKIQKRAFTYDAFIDKIGPAESIIDPLVGASPGTIVKPVTYNNGSLIIRLDSVTVPEDEVFTKEKDSLVEQLTSFKRKKLLSKWFKEEAPRSELFRSLDTL